MEVFERLKKVIDTCSNGSQTAFSKLIGESQSTFHGYMNLQGQEKLKVRTIVRILDAFSVDANWLLLGIGSMFRTARPDAAAPADPIAQRVDQVASAMREAGVDELKILAAARDMLEGEISKLTRARGGYGVAEAHPGMPKAAEDSACYSDPRKAAGDDTV